MAAGPALLARITADLSTGDDLRELLNRFLDPIVRIAGARAGAVRALGDGGDASSLELVGHVGLPESFRDAEQSVDRHCGFCGEAADAGRVVWATDLRHCAQRGLPAVVEAGCQRMLTVPLRHRGRVLGVYNLFFDAGPEPAADVRELLASVGDLLGLALNNARLEAQTLRAGLLQQRQAMAAEVHDSVAQTLAFVKMRLPLLEDALLAHDDTQSRRYLDDVRQAVGEVHASLREIVTHLRTRFDPRGLGAALESLATRFAGRSGVALHYDNRMPTLSLGTERDLELYHLVQEALANVERHARAGTAWLSVRGDDTRVAIEIDDDGVGFDPAAGAVEAAGHHGLAIMRERAQRLGAEIALSARPAGGTRVRLLVPRPEGSAP